MAIHRPARGGTTPRLNLVLFLYGLLTTGMLIHSSFKGAPKAAGGERSAAADDKLLARLDQTLGAVDSLVKNLPAQGVAAAAVGAKAQVGWVALLGGSTVTPSRASSRGHVCAAAAAAAAAPASAGLPGVPHGCRRCR